MNRREATLRGVRTAHEDAKSRRTKTGAPRESSCTKKLGARLFPLGNGPRRDSRRPSRLERAPMVHGLPSPPPLLAGDATRRLRLRRDLHDPQFVCTVHAHENLHREHPPQQPRPWVPRRARFFGSFLVFCGSSRTEELALNTRLASHARLVPTSPRHDLDQYPAYRLSTFGGRYARTALQWHGASIACQPRCRFPRPLAREPLIRWRGLRRARDEARAGLASQAVAGPCSLASGEPGWHAQ